MANTFFLLARKKTKTNKKTVFNNSPTHFLSHYAIHTQAICGCKVDHCVFWMNQIHPSMHVYRTVSILMIISWNFVMSHTLVWQCMWMRTDKHLYYICIQWRVNVERKETIVSGHHDLWGTTKMKIKKIWYKKWCP